MASQSLQSPKETEKKISDFFPDKNLVKAIALNLNGNSNLVTIDNHAYERESDMIILAAGVTPNMSLLHGTNITLGSSHAVSVDEKMRTNIRIYQLLVILQKVTL
ncbi:hypothetical protein HB848_08635 [Listeria rocourtiae]|nr:hypothetical protein [Listeria rocourtiae]